MEDKEEKSEARGEFANDFMVFCLSLNKILKSNGIKQLKF